MTQIIATYHAPAGDEQVVTMGGVRFFNGQPVEIDLDTEELVRLGRKLETNPHFTVDGDVPAAETDLGKGGEALGYVARHRGGGSYSIMKGDEEVVQKLTKADADAFNALSVGDKLAYVEASRNEGA